jgi:hypothetical protein
MKSEIGLAERVENPCVGGSIPPRATKIYNKAFHPVGLGFECSLYGKCLPLYLP